MSFSKCSNSEGENFTHLKLVIKEIKARTMISNLQNVENEASSSTIFQKSFSCFFWDVSAPEADGHTIYQSLQLH